jgi:hypothetical protein
MLYRLSPSNDGLGSLEPLSFLDASDLQRTEKDPRGFLNFISKPKCRQTSRARLRTWIS